MGPSQAEVSRSQPLYLLLPPLLAWLLFLLASQALHGRGDVDTLYRSASTLTWLSGAWLLIRLVNGLFWDRWIPQRGGVRVPRLLRQVVALVVLILAVGALLNQVWQVSVVPVVAATGAVGIVAGLALRNVLSDFFSGIALNMERPFGLDDFVLLHVRARREPVAGFVREVNWRSTTVLTPEDNLISVPNSEVARATVENLSFPSPVYELELEIVLDWMLDLTAVEAVLSAAMMDAWASGATSGDKPPKFRIRRLDAAGVAYKIVYLIDPRKKPKGPARHTLLTALHRHLRFAGLRPVQAPDLLHGQVPAPQRLLDHARQEDRLAGLEQITLLTTLTETERVALAAALTVRRVAEHETVVREGDTGDTMYFVLAGVLEACVALPEGSAAEVRRNTLAPGAFFGEMSLLTGAPRSATIRALCDSVLYEVPRAVIAQLLDVRPALADGLSKAVAQHQLRGASTADGPTSAAPQRPGNLAEQMAARIRAFFATRR
jgi:small-conductance mechanosensitive channel/CRP-like cAMP-binding protein